MSRLSEKQWLLIELFAEIYAESGKLERMNVFSSGDVWHAMSAASVNHYDRAAIDEVFSRVEEIWGVEIPGIRGDGTQDEKAPKPHKNDGWVYVLKNEMLPGLVKIGFTTIGVAARIKQLSRSTSIPTPFELVAEFPCADPASIESAIHAELTECRMPGREFFRIPEVVAVATCERFAGGAQ